MRAFRSILLVVVLFLSVHYMGSAQGVIEHELYDLFEAKDTATQDFTSPIKNAFSDISVFVSVGFFGYKAFVSSQDNPSCVFTPSCSEYAVQSIQEKGFFLGWLNSFDRLCRCHGLVGHHHYPFDIEKMRYYDPVQDK